MIDIGIHKINHVGIFYLLNQFGILKECKGKYGCQSSSEDEYSL